MQLILLGLFQSLLYHTNRFLVDLSLGGTDDMGEICIPTADLDLLADELVEFGWDVEIIAPEHLRTLIHKRFDVLRVTHEGTS